MTATLARKTFTDVRIKDAAEGIVEAVIATLGVKDHDGDVAYKSAFDDGAPVVISAYGHASWKGELPVGHGVLRVTDTEAIVEAKFLMDTTHGRDTFLTVKALGDVGLQEWSYSLQDVKSHRGELHGEKVNFIDRVTVKEASPVLVGAGLNTRNLSAKGAKQLDSDLRRNLRAAAQERWADDETWVWVLDFDLDDLFAIVEIEGPDEFRLVQVDFARGEDGTVTLADGETEVQQVTTYAPKGASFSEHATAVMAAVEALTVRASEVVALRAEKGKTISESSAGLLKQLTDGLEALRAVVDQPAQQAAHDDVQAAVDAEFLRFVATSQGVTS